MCRKKKQVSLEQIADVFKIPRIRSEDNINLNRNVLGRMRGKFQIRKSEKYFSVEDSPVPSGGDHILKKHIIDLYNRTTGKGHENYITGLRLHYAADKGTFFIVYQPVILVATKKLSDKGKYYLYEAVPGSEKGDYYLYACVTENGEKCDDPSKYDFVSLLPKKADCYIKQYQELGKIRHAADRGEEKIKFIPKVDSEYAVFSFQEIFHLIYQNDADSIYLYNAAIRSRHDPYSEIRQSIIISYRELVKEDVGWWQRFFSFRSFLTGTYEAEKSFRGRLANLAHLCPPHRDVVFKLRNDIAVRCAEEYTFPQDPYFKKNNIAEISDMFLYDAKLIQNRVDIEKLPKETAAGSENKIDLGRNGVKVSNAESYIDICNKYIALNAQKIADVEPDRIGNMSGAEAENQFNTIRNTLMAEQLKKYNMIPEHYVTALKIHYGVNEWQDPVTGRPTYKLIFVYEPILMERGTEMGTDNKLYRYVEKPLTEKLYYICDPADGKFKPKTAAEAMGHKTLYSTKLTFRHYSDTDLCTPYINTLDTEYALISFQEFFNFIRKDITTPRPVSIFSAISWWEHYPAIEARHSILISPNSGVKVDIYGNLAHLCPPHRDVYYRLL